MKKNNSPIIEATALLKLFQTEDIIIVDACSGEKAISNYKEKHLEGALFVDLDTHLAAIKNDASNGGRHPLPTIKQFSKTLSNLGISKNSHVVIYDDKNGSNSAARFWWMLRSAGLKKVQVLNGGIQAAVKIGFPTSSKIVNAKEVENYNLPDWVLPQATIDEVEKNASDKNNIVIDVRSSDRYNGLTEPIDLIAGHIPGAINIPLTSNLDSDGFFLSPEKLRTKYQKVLGNFKPANTIVHCGSGVTACHTILAMVYAGFEFPKLYVGSWSEWSRNNKPIATNKNG